MNTKSLTINIEFHPPRHSDFALSVASYVRIMSRLFGTDAQVVYSSEETQEVIFSVKQPILYTEDSMVEFFENIAVVFEKFAEHSPHFTQFEG